MEPTRTELRWALKVAMTEGNAEDRRQATAALADHQARATAVAALRAKVTRYAWRLAR